jgi:hypothetical protein
MFADKTNKICNVYTIFSIFSSRQILSLDTGKKGRNKFRSVVPQASV